MAILDIILLVLLIIFAIIGFSKGLVDSILSLFGFLLSAILAIVFGQNIANIIRTKWNIDLWFDNFMVEYLKVADDSVNFFGIANVSRIAVSKFLATVFIILATFIILRLAIRLIGKILGKITDSSSLLKGLNRVLGLVFGALKGTLLVCVLFSFVSLVCLVGPIRSKIEPTITNTTITKFLYENTREFVSDKFSEQISEVTNKKN